MHTADLINEGLRPSPGKRVRRSGLHSLTGLRFIAALYVMFFHFGAGYTKRAHMPDIVTQFLTRGNLGVCLFFTLSGFILFYTYKGNLQTGQDVYKFFVARFARLYPAYLLAIIFQALIIRQLPRGETLLIFPMLQSWTPATSGLGYSWIMQAWTISVEAFFYICFPFLLAVLSRKFNRSFLWMAASLLFIIVVASQAPFAHPGLAIPGWAGFILLPLLCLPEFLMGMVLGYLFLNKTASVSKTHTNDWITFAGLIPGLLIIAISANLYILSAAAMWCMSWGIYRLAHGQGFLTRLLSSKAMMLLGGASFSIYLLQAPVREAMHLLIAARHPGLDNILYPFVLIPLCCLIFLFYEEPMRDILRKTLVRRNGS